jgi:hypothetical protein
VAKNSDAGTGPVPMSFNARCGRFDDPSAPGA